MQLFMSPKDAAKSCGIGRTFLYQLIAENKIKSHVCGRKRLIETESLVAYIQSQPSTASHSVPGAAAFRAKE